MISHQYHCACCNKVLSSQDKECPDCGSHHIKSPYGFWVLCFIVCLAFIILIRIFNIHAKEKVIEEKLVTDSVLEYIDKSRSE